MSDHSANPEEYTYSLNGNGAGAPSLESAIVRTVAYVDVFDYPLTAEEVHRYLVGMAVPVTTVKAALANGRLVPHRLSHQEGFFALPGRETVVVTRQRRSTIAREMWPQALGYAQTIAALPFVRMVAVTGSLAVDNVERGADIDYLVVTKTGRLWLCRAMVILVVRLAARQGTSLCPNYFLSERSLVFRERNLYTARELAQMVPVAGWPTYYQMRRDNTWTADFLPNADDLPRAPLTEQDVAELSPTRRSVRAFAETVLHTPPANWLEWWEMARKVRKFGRQNGHNGEAAFSPDWCKGHFHEHGRRILETFANQVKQLEREIGDWRL